MVYFYDLAGHIKEAAKYHDYNPGWKIGAWLQGLFGGWGGTILRLAVLIGIFIILSIIKAAIMAGLRKCITGWRLKSTPKKHETKPEPEMTLLAGARDRDFPIKGAIFPHLPQPLLYTPSATLAPDVSPACNMHTFVHQAPVIKDEELIQLITAAKLENDNLHVMFGKEDENVNVEVDQDRGVQIW